VYAGVGRDIVHYETGERLVSGREFPSRGFADSQCTILVGETSGSICPFWAEEP
jgi:hypothetical protein